MLRTDGWKEGRTTSKQYTPPPKKKKNTGCGGIIKADMLMYQGSKYKFSLKEFNCCLEDDNSMYIELMQFTIKRKKLAGGGGARVNDFFLQGVQI